MSKITSIDFVENEDVYNMEVENHHNFAVNGGFIVHNCDSLRYFCIMRQSVPVVEINQVRSGFYLESELEDMVTSKKITKYQMKEYLKKGVKSW
jgi:hypothetical protein